MSAVINLTDEAWDAEYKPIRNHFKPSASEYDSEYQLFETYGQELKFVQNTDPKFVWTQIDGDDGGIYIVNGYASVNRIGYYITAKPHDPNKFISICVIAGDEMPDACDQHEWASYGASHTSSNIRYCINCGQDEE